MTTTATVAPTTTRTATRARRLPSVVAMAVAIVIGALLSTAAAVSPAAAASAFSYCFRHTNGSPYTYDAYLDYWANGRWNTFGSLGKSVNGCNSFTVNSSSWLRNYPLRVEAYVKVGTVVFRGTTPYYAPAGAGSYNLGTGLVNS